MNQQIQKGMLFAPELLRDPRPQHCVATLHAVGFEPTTKLMIPNYAEAKVGVSLQQRTGDGAL